ncbi:MAG: type III polyketide synthase [Acidiferrobacterales bacterium]
MSVFIHNIATAVPPTVYRQDFVCNKMKEYVRGDRRLERLVERIYARSSIEKRHSVVEDLFDGRHSRLFFLPNQNTLAPTTATRNAIYTRHARRLAMQVGANLMAGNPAIGKRDITHVVTVSCTGFFAPGPEYVLVKELGLARSTRRYHIGFMGCFGAFQAMQLARSFCQAEVDAAVMIVCLEICTLHLQQDTKLDNLVSASLFGDGAAGAIVSSRPPAPGTLTYRVEEFASAIAEEGEKQMAWTIGDLGFEMVLSQKVSDTIAANLPGVVTPLLQSLGVDQSEVSQWAIHPGGRAILDEVEKGLNLKCRQVESSRYVLANYGNLSSASIFFVLKHILDTTSTGEGEAVLAMAFGPGLAIECGLFSKVRRRGRDADLSRS